MQKGMVYGFLAYLLWGLFPIYWKFLQHVNPLETLVHRILWAFVFVLITLTVRKKWNVLSLIRQQPKMILTFTLTSILITANWFTYLWAVTHNYIVEASLGYFINPLINVALGVIFLKERLRSGQLVAIVIAVIGVAYLTITYGSFPWIAIILALCFGFYGLLRKTAPLESLEGLFLETSILFFPCLVVVLFFIQTDQSAFVDFSHYTPYMLIFGGAITAVPLLLFSASARRITLIALGLLQYIAPTLQFLIGVYIYGEQFNRARFIGFCFIWTALIIYTVESIWRARQLSSQTT
jgi:chloramphenicol-sensitive protein RarD